MTFLLISLFSSILASSRGNNSITSRIDLPNGNTRIVLSGQRRVKVLSYVNYSNETDILESIFVT